MALNRDTTADESYSIVTSKRRHKSRKKSLSHYIMAPREHTVKEHRSRQQPKRQTGTETSTRRPHKSSDGQSELKPIKKTCYSAAGTSWLIERGAQQAALLESIIIEYSLTHAFPQLFHSVEATSLNAITRFRFIHKYGDPFTFLNVVREWTRQLNKGTSKAWCLEWKVDEQVLRALERYVSKCCVDLKMSRGVELNFNDDLEETDSKLLAILMDVYAEGLCVYRGHPDLGYWSVSKWRTVHISSTSVLSQLGIWNQFILALQDISSTDTIHSAIPVLPDSGQSLLDTNFNPAKQMLPLMTVVPVSLQNIGPSTKNALLQHLQYSGNGGLQQKILNRCEGNNLLMENEQDKMGYRNDFTIYVSPKDHDTALGLLKEAVKEIQMEGDEQCSEMPYPNKDSPVRTLVCAGGAVSQILLPHEFRSILIERIQNELTKDDIIKRLSVFGKIDQLIKFENCHPKWGIVVFNDPKSVQKVLSSHGNLDNMLVELTSLRETEQLSPIVIDQNRSVKVKICRRPLLSGKALVTFQGRREYSRAIDAKSFQVSGVQISGLKPDSKGQFLLEGLDKATQEEDVREGLNTLGLQPSNVIIHRESSFSCNAAELEKFKAGINRVLDKVTDIRKVTIRVEYAQEDDIYLKAHIVFANQRIASSAMESLCHAKIQNIPLEVEVEEESINTTRVDIHEELYKILKADLDHFTKIASKRFEVDVQQVSSSNGVQFRITHTLPHKVDIALEHIQQILAPRRLSLSIGMYNYLTSGKGLYLLSAVKSQTQILFYLNRKQLDFYGPTEAKSSALKLYQKYIVERHNWFALQVSMISDDAGRVCECVAILCKKYGPSLADLSTKCNLSCLVFDSSTKSFIGSSKDTGAKESLVHAMDNCCLGKVKIDRGNSSLPECCACFCEPEDKDSTFYLQGCSHAYCITCASQHAQYAIDSRNFPVICAKENCGKSICTKDLAFLADLAFKDGQKHFIKVAVEKYVISNKESWCYCYNPYCQGLVYKDDRFESYACMSCNSKICKLCLQHYHPAVFRCDDAHNEKALAQWFDSNKTNRKRCPSCKMGIEKNAGCNRVSCTSCNKHICWVCLAHFSDMTACYDHLSKEHPGT